MDFLSQATNVSNWTLSLVLGTSAALQSGTQGGIVGELPMCDFLLAMPLFRKKANRSRGETADNKDTDTSNPAANGKGDGTSGDPRRTYGTISSNTEQHTAISPSSAPAIRQKQKQPSNGHAPSSSESASGVKTQHQPSNNGGYPSSTPSTQGQQNGTSSRASESGCTQQDQQGKGPREYLLVGFDTWWSRMMVKSLQTKHLDLTYLPMRKGEVGCPRPDEQSEVDPCCNATVPSSGVTPRMFYGLIGQINKSNKPKDENQAEQHTPTHYRTVHRTTCLLSRQLEYHVCEFMSRRFKASLGLQPSDENLCPGTYEKTKDLSKKIIDDMIAQVEQHSEVDEWAKHLMSSIRDLLDWDNNLKSKKCEDRRKNEIMDRIYSRIPDMLRNLKIEKFLTEGDDEDAESCSSKDGKRAEGYSIKDVTDAFVTYLGIKRACLVSDMIYNDETPALMFTGYNVEAGHQLLEDVSQVPSQEQVGFPNAQLIESSQRERIIDTKVADMHMYLVIIFDAVLSLGIMMLSGLGPILCMYTARKMTSSYRESTKRMGTSMRWSISRVVLYHTGTARDDWMVCIIPVKNYRHRMAAFIALSAVASIAPFILWLFIDNTTRELNNLTKMLCASSCLVAALFIIAASVSEKLDEMPICRKVSHVAACLVSISLPAIAVFTGMQDSRLYAYGLESLFTIQWVIGEVLEIWLHECTAFFMLGVVGAIRFSTYPDNDDI